jgi:hypothetical protein
VTSTAAQLSQTFNVVSVPLNATAQKGDKLGFSVSEGSVVGIWAFSMGNLTPYCNLENTVRLWITWMFMTSRP